MNQTVLERRLADQHFDQAGPPERSGASQQARVPYGSEAMLRREISFRRLLGAADLAAVAITVAVVSFIVGDKALQPAAAAIPVAFILLMKAVGLYDRDEHLLHKTTLDEVPRLLAVSTATVLALFLANGAVIEGVLTRGEIAIAWTMLLALLVCLRAFARTIALRLTAPERCLFVGDGPSAADFREKLATSHSVNAELVGWVSAGGPEDASLNGSQNFVFAERIRGLLGEREVHRVVVGPGPSHPSELIESIRRMAGRRVKVSLLPDVSRVVSTAVELDRLNGLTLLGLSRLEVTRSSHVIKRLFDICGSTAALVLCAPLMLVVAIAARIDSPGPALFRQQRAGRHGRPFEMLKFRSMCAGAEDDQGRLSHLNEGYGVFKIENDPRITRVGRVIRRLHLDELPQLINVLRGEMSLVGPRPLPLEEDRRIVGWHRRRLDLRPGITGPWQVLGSARIPTSEMVELDYQYVANWSVWNDIRLLLLTVGHVVRRRGR